LTSNKYHIWNQHKKLSRLMCVSNGFFEVFFRSNFDPWSPSRICWKMILMKTSILLFSYLFFCLQVTFYKSRTSFLLFKQLFDQNHFSTYPWGGPGVKIWPKKNFAETIWNTHKSTQFFVLIPNMIFVRSQTGIILFENRQIWVKKNTNWVSRIVVIAKVLY